MIRTRYQVMEFILKGMSRGMKKTMKKILAMILAAAVTLSLSGCYSENNLWAAKVGDEELPIGVYIYFMQSAYQDAQAMVGTDKKVASADIEGQKGEDWIRSKAETDIKKYFFVKEKFEALGLSFSDEDLETIDSNVDSTWSTSAKALESMGVAKESLRPIAENDTRLAMLREALYSKDGERGATDEELTAYYEENYFNYAVVSVPMTKKQEAEADDENTESSAAATAETVALTDDEKDTLREELEDMLAEAKKGNKTLEELAEEYKETNPNIGEADTIFYPGPTKSANAAGSELFEEILALNEGEFTELEETGSGTTGYFAFGQKTSTKESLEEILADESQRLNLVLDMKSEDFTSYLDEQAADYGSAVFNESALKKQKLSLFVTSDIENGTSSIPAESSEAEDNAEASSEAASEPASSEENSISSEASSAAAG